MTSEPRERHRVWRSRARLARIPAIVAMVGIWAWLALPSGLGGPLGVIWVSGDSMEPTLYTDDVAVVYRTSTYDIGDVIAFTAPEGGVVIHRIVDVDAEGYVPRGDNRNEDDHWRPTEADITGEMVLRIPGAGHVLTRLRSPSVLGVLTAVLTMGLLLTRPDKRDPSD